MLKNNDIKNAVVDETTQFDWPYGCDLFEVMSVTKAESVITVKFYDRRSNANPSDRIFSLDLRFDVTVAQAKSAVHDRLSAMALPHTATGGVNH